MGAGWIWLARAATLALGGLVLLAAFGPAPVVEWTQDRLTQDKLLHGVANFAIVVGLAAALPRIPLWIIGLCVLAVGVGVEFGQEFVGRSGHWTDVAANLAGVLAALCAAAAVTLRAGHRAERDPRARARPEDQAQTRTAAAKSDR